MIGCWSGDAHSDADVVDAASATALVQFGRSLHLEHARPAEHDDADVVDADVTDGHAAAIVVVAGVDQRHRRGADRRRRFVRRPGTPSFTEFYRVFFLTSSILSTQTTTETNLNPAPTPTPVPAVSPDEAAAPTSAPAEVPPPSPQQPPQPPAAPVSTPSPALNPLLVELTEVTVLVPDFPGRSSKNGAGGRRTSTTPASAVPPTGADDRRPDDGEPPLATTATPTSTGPFDFLFRFFFFLPFFFLPRRPLMKTNERRFCATTRKKKRDGPDSGTPANEWRPLVNGQHARRGSIIQLDFAIDDQPAIAMERLSAGTDPERERERESEREKWPPLGVSGRCRRAFI